MKKRTFSLLLIAAMFLSLLPAMSLWAGAETTYDLYVAGVQVTSGNKNDVLENGVFSYDPSAKKLTVSGNCTCTKNAINNRIDGLTVYAEKDATLQTTSNYAVISTTGDLTVTGPGMLTLHCTGSSVGIYVTDRKTVKLENARVKAMGEYGVWTLLNGKNEKLIVINSYLYASGENGAICNLNGGILLDGCGILEPEGAMVDGGKIVNQDGSAANSVTIGVEYDLTVYGVQVNNGNAPDILDNGVFSFDAATNTLTVKGSYSCQNKSAIISGIQGLTLYAAEYSELATDVNYASIAVTGDLKITGPGKLVLSNTRLKFGVILVLEGAKVTIEYARVEISTAGNYGVWGATNTFGEELTVKDSCLRIEAGKAAVAALDGITISGYSEIVEPAGAKIEGGKILNADGSDARTVVIDVPKHNIWIAGRQVTAANRNDVFGDGHVKFYEKGEYTPTALDEKYDFGGTTFKYSYVLVLDNYKSTFPSFYENGDKSAQLYIDEDVYVVLKGENALYKGTWWDMEYNDMICHGIYTGEDSIHFMGDGSLVAYADFCEKEGLYGESTSLYISEEAKVTLYGKYGMYQKFVGDTPWLTVEDNAVLTCHGMGTDDVDYPGLYCAEVEVRNHGELICTTTGLRREAMSTWGSSFSCDYYDIKILKTDESGSTPFAPEGGINVTGGVKEGNCRYIDIKGKTTYVTGIRFSYDTYKLTPEKSSVTVWAQLLPSGAPELYNDLTWTTSDASVATVQKTGKTGCVITAVGNGTAIITATAPGGATGSVTVTVEGFTAASQRIDEVNIVSSFLVPTAGETVDGYLALSVPDGMPYTLNEVKWYRSGNEYPLEATDVFEEEIFYYIMLNVAPAAGYYFDKSHKPTALLNGLESNVDGIYTSVEQDGTLTFFSVDVKPEVQHFLYGDVNHDGAVNKKDSLALKKYLADNSYGIDKEAADVFKDNKVNKKDSLLLKQYLAGWSVELGKS